MERTRLDEMREQVKAFHEKHPEVWDMFVRFTADIRNRGFKNYSVYAIFERIRWEKDVGGDGVTMFKLNNNYRPFYARAYMKKFPEAEGFFRTREQTSSNRPASDLPELTPEHFDG
jgi:hypothetical protein